MLGEADLEDIGSEMNLHVLITTAQIQSGLVWTERMSDVI